jgi:hypothetical protein
VRIDIPLRRGGGSIPTDNTMAEDGGGGGSSGAEMLELLRQEALHNGLFNLEQVFRCEKNKEKN